LSCFEELLKASASQLARAASIGIDNSATMAAMAAQQREMPKPAGRAF
jgi:hypothetical protein